MRQRLLFLILWFSALLYILHRVALTMDLYYASFWADIITHTIAGALVGGIALYLASWFKKKTEPSLVSLLLFVLIVGVLWEVFEVMNQLVVVSDEGYVLDTIGDLYFDIFGAYLFLRLLPGFVPDLNYGK